MGKNNVSWETTISRKARRNGSARSRWSTQQVDGLIDRLMPAEDQLAEAALSLLARAREGVTRSLLAGRLASTGARE